LLKYLLEIPPFLPLLLRLLPLFYPHDITSKSLDAYRFRVWPNPLWTGSRFWIAKPLCLASTMGSCLAFLKRGLIQWTTLSSACQFSLSSLLHDVTALQVQ
jgi:hypothetical protein